MDSSMVVILLLFLLVPIAPIMQTTMEDAARRVIRTRHLLPTPHKLLLQTCGRLCRVSWVHSLLMPGMVSISPVRFSQALSRHSMLIVLAESYGGHYGPVFNEYFEQQNAANISGAMKISLESVAIGNGWFEPNLQYQAFYNFTVNPGNTYDLRPFNSSVEEQMYNALYG